MRLITIQKHIFAVGLFWQLRHEGPASKKEMLKTARITAKEFTEDAYNAVAIRTQQFGLGKIDKLPKQTYSLAAAIRPHGIQDTFLGVFCLEHDLFWVVAFSKGIIAADGDACFSTLEAARNAAHSIKQLFSTGTEITCNTPEESLDYITPLLQLESPIEEIKPDKQVKQKKLIQLLWGLLFFGIIYSSITVYNYLEDLEAKRILQLSLDAAETYKKDLQEHPERHFKMHWLESPLVNTSAKQCIDTIVNQPLALQGWSLEEIVCLPGQSISISRQHNRGASFTTLPAKMRIVTSQKTIEGVPLSSLPQRPFLAHGQLPTKDSSAAILYAITQAIGCNLSLLAFEPPEQETKNDIVLTAPWFKGKFELTTIPNQIILEPELFTSLTYPGFVLEKLSYNAIDFNWKIQGVLYVRIGK